MSTVDALASPVWHALTSLQQWAAEPAGVGPLAVRYRPDIGPFAAVADLQDPACWQALESLIGRGGEAVLIVPDDAPMPPGPWPPPGWVLRASVPGRQLLGEGMAGPGPAPTTVAGPGEGMAGPGPAPTTVAGPGEGMAGPGEGMAGPGEGVAGPGPAPTTVGGHGGLLVSLGPADSAEMAELVERTRPGPFAARTVELGGYLGVRREGRLVAMAGWRLQLPGFVEISAVCTDPLERGRGLASRLVRAVAAAARRQGSIPFLHVAEANTGAIRLYESLGMRTVRTVRFCALQAR